LPAGDFSPLAGRSQWRLRVGGWRVIVERIGPDFLILTIRSRGDVYKR
jgi:hypothetical protein